MRLHTRDGVSWVWGPVLWVVAFFIAVLHLQSYRVTSGQLRRQVRAALSVSGQASYNLPHSVFSSPETRHGKADSAAVKASGLLLDLLVLLLLLPQIFAVFSVLNYFSRA